MKPFRRIIYGLMLVAGVISCGPAVTFDEPQPADHKDLPKIPKRLQGVYISHEDSSMLIIDENSIQRVLDYEITIHVNQLDSNTSLSADTLIDINTNEKFPFKRVGDSLIVYYHFSDLLFHMDDGVLKRYKGYYFLNTPYFKEGWEVKKLELSKGQLVMSRISSEKDIENLKELAASQIDTIAPYQMVISKKRFKKYIRNGFSEGEIFIKQ